MSIIRKIEKFIWLYIKKDRVGYARKIGVHVGDNCQILADPGIAFGTEPWLISLGDHVDVTAGVEFLNHEGGIWCARGIDPFYNTQDLFAPISVGNNVMIGVNSLIMPGVHIGNNVIIGGHSVVTKDIPDGTIVAGIPAKPISTIDAFMERLKNRVTIPTKHLSSDDKRKYLLKHMPEIFPYKQ